MKIADVMTPAVELVDPDMKCRDAARMMRDNNVGGLPVGKDDRLVGMITDRDIAVRGVADELADDASIRDVMSEGVFYCYDDQSLEEAGKRMARHQVHRLPVVDRDKHLIGFIALADLARNGEEGQSAAVEALTGISRPTGVPRQ